MFEFLNEFFFEKESNSNKLLVDSDSLEEMSQENCATVNNFENNTKHKHIEYLEDDLVNIIEGSYKNSRIKLTLLYNPDKDKPLYFIQKQVFFDKRLNSFQTYRGEEVLIADNLNELFLVSEGKLIFTYEINKKHEQVPIKFKLNMNPQKYSNVIIKRKMDKIIFTVLYQDDCYFLTKFIYYAKL